MEIHVPEDIGGKLRLLPEDTYDATIQDIFYGLSKASDAPKLTVKWVITSEFSGKQDKNYVSTIGENVLETFSLQPQALWNLNDLYMDVVGEPLPQGDHEPEAFVAMMKEKLLGAEGKIRIEIDPASGEERSKVAERKF